MVVSSRQWKPRIPWFSLLIFCVYCLVNNPESHFDQRGVMLKHFLPFYAHCLSWSSCFCKLKLARDCARSYHDESKGPITWWVFSPANRAEISDRLLKQILWKPSCRLHGEGFSPGRNSARGAIQPGLKKEREHAYLLCFRTSVNFLTEICVLRPGWNWACNRNNISARAEIHHVIRPLLEDEAEIKS